MLLTKLSLIGNNLIKRESLAGDGKISNLFNSVCVQISVLDPNPDLIVSVDLGR